MSPGPHRPPGFSQNDPGGPNAQFGWSVAATRRQVNETTPEREKKCDNRGKKKSDTWGSWRRAGRKRGEGEGVWERKKKIVSKSKTKEKVEIKCIIHAVVNSLCGLRSCLSCGTCTAFVCCTDTLRIQAITAEELESRFASEWETDHLPLS